MPLTVGRKLAFTSVTEAGSLEWSTAVLGEGKRRGAEALLGALRARLAPGALVQMGYGEWYVGEPVPRWRLTCLYRSDGEPLWRNAALLDAPETGTVATIAAAEAFGRALVRALGIPPSCVVPAYEDPLYRLWRDARGGAVASAPDELRDPERRRELADRLTNDAAGPPVGYALPLQHDDVHGRWQSGAWAFRRGRLYLLAGTLGMGFRLPLESLPTPQETAEDDAFVPRTALCLEMRDGRLFVFMPPLPRVEHFLELIRAIARSLRASGGNR